MKHTYGEGERDEGFCQEMGKCPRGSPESTTLEVKEVRGGGSEHWVVSAEETSHGLQCWGLESMQAEAFRKGGSVLGGGSRELSLHSVRLERMVD